MISKKNVSIIGLGHVGLPMMVNLSNLKKNNIKMFTLGNTI